MYVNTRGLGKYRGMGLNCPGDPGCPGYVEPNVNAAIQAALDARDDSPGGMTPAPVPLGSSITGWLNQNAGMALAVGGGFFALLLLAKAGR